MPPMTPKTLSFRRSGAVDITKAAYNVKLATCRDYTGNLHESRAKVERIDLNPLRARCGQRAPPRRWWVSLVEPDLRAG